MINDDNRYEVQQYSKTLYIPSSINYHDDVEARHVFLTFPDIRILHIHPPPLQTFAPAAPRVSRTSLAVRAESPELPRGDPPMADPRHGGKWDVTGVSWTTKVFRDNHEIQWKKKAFELDITFRFEMCQLAPSNCASLEEGRPPQQFGHEPLSTTCPNMLGKDGETSSNHPRKTVKQL